MSTVEHGEIVEYEPPAPPANLFRTDQPDEIVTRATATATALADVVKKQKLTTRIGQSDHVRVEGWTLLGTMLGVFPVCVWTRKLDDGWEARVEARTMAGVVVGAAEAQCLRSERTWSSRDDYALRSMAQTRATSKALRQPLGFVMSLAGFSPTPAEEMPSDPPQRRGPDPAVVGTPFDGDAYEAAPAQSQFVAPTDTANPLLASGPQQKNIRRLVAKIAKDPELRWDESDLWAQMEVRFGTGKVAELSKADAGSLIDSLKKLAGEES